MKRILAFGDSFVFGDLDDFGPGDCNYNPEFHTHGMSNWDREVYVKNNVSFVALLAKEFGCNLENMAQRGSGNYQQLDSLLEFIEEKSIQSGDVILFGITSTIRDRIDQPNPPLPNRHSIFNKHIAVKGYVNRFDLFYILSTLDVISRTYNVPILKFNIFDNAVYDPLKNIKFNFDNYLGQGLKANTLINILNNDWGQDIARPVFHTAIKPKADYEKYYTWNRHPSELGHQKIADWFLKNINWNQLNTQ